MTHHSASGAEFVPPFEKRRRRGRAAVADPPTWPPPNGTAGHPRPANCVHHRAGVCGPGPASVAPELPPSEATQSSCRTEWRAGTNRVPGQVLPVTA